MSTTSLKLSEELKQRAVAAAERKGVSPHAFMVNEIEQAAVQGSNLRIHLAGSMVHVGDKNANVTAADVRASNGIIHVIDAVVLPAM